ncbi:MAG: NADP-dependent malic enzyme [Promethearchaeota archaeon]
MKHRRDDGANAGDHGELALRLHRFYRGKVQVLPRCRVRDLDDFAIWYTPGVAAPSRAIAKDPELAYEHAFKWNAVAVVSDGTRVLGLGDVGPLAGLPVMEGKALLFKYLGGVDAWPLCVGPGLDADDLVQLVKWIQPTFGGVNLEDVEKPKCFRVLDALRSDPDVTIPVWHDDQQGTAAVTLAGVLNALKVVGKTPRDVRVVFFGAGASNTAIGRLLRRAGFDPKKAVYVDSRGIVHPDRGDLDEYKRELAELTNGEDLRGGPEVALSGADVLVALSTPGPGVVKGEWVRAMADDAVVFACANPVPEIHPRVAKAAGARVVGTGRSDFPNQVNNSLGFPGIFRGTLDVRATTITDEMCIAAAEALAKYQEDSGRLDEDHVLPAMGDPGFVPLEAAAVGRKAVEQGVARLNLSFDELFERADRLARAAKEATNALMQGGFIPPAPTG